jgi:DNA polymerase delta subunit 1
VGGVTSASLSRSRAEIIKALPLSQELELELELSTTFKPPQEHPVRIMALSTPLKRVLVDTTNTAQNIANSPVSATKKRKLEASNLSAKAFRKPTGPNSSAPGSSQVKSHFESEVLEKLSQNLDGLKKTNQEKDQQWPRPSLNDFHPDSENLVFQQIEAEEGSLMGGKTTVRLFGVTEVCCF